MRHKENIRGGDIMLSLCAGVEHQLSTITYNESTFLWAILFSFLNFFRGWNCWTAEHCNKVSAGAAWWKRTPGDSAALRVWFVDPSDTSEGWRASLLHWGRASAMFTVMFQGMLRGFKHIKRIYRNTDIGNAAGRGRHIPENTHARDCNMTPHKRNKTNK